jgi:hypothetical protein
VGQGWIIHFLERVRPVLVVALSAVAALMMVGGIACKSTRWTNISNGTGMAWKDGVKPWALWAFLGGLAVLALVGVSWWYDRWLLCGIGALVLFWQAGFRASGYRTQLESSDWITIYDHQRIALGLRLVPAVATVGMLSAALLIAATVALLLKERGPGRPLLSHS